MEIELVNIAHDNRDFIGEQHFCIDKYGNKYLGKIYLSSNCIFSCLTQEGEEHNYITHIILVNDK